MSLISSLTVWACGGEESTGPPPAVASVEVTPAAVTLVSLGETVQLTASAQDASGNAIADKSFTWSSSDDSIATVSNAGLVTALVNGSVTITAATGGVRGTAAVGVAQTAAQLGFAVQPTVAVIGIPIRPVVQVAIEDALGNVVAGATDTVTLVLGVNTSGATLKGTTTQSPMDGVATFSDLSLDRTGVGYTLVASLASVPDVTSASFDVITLVLVSVSAGAGHTCGVTTTGPAYCWGSNEHGQLGTEADVDRCRVVFPSPSRPDSVPCSPTPIRVAGGLNFATVSAGGRHTCGVTTTAAAYCWGYGDDGQLGDGTLIARPTPVPVAGGIAFASVSTSSLHTCGLTTESTAYCWGWNLYSQLGDGTTTDRATPVAVSGALSFASVSAGRDHTCGVTAGGTAYCWGQNTDGQLGDGTTTDRTTPVAIAGGLNLVSVSAGGPHTCAVTSSGTVYCWGQNTDGPVGDGTTIDRTTPVPVSGGLTFASVSTSPGHNTRSNHTCGLTTNGTAYCWGGNNWGQLGDGTRDISSIPVRVIGQP